MCSKTIRRERWLCVSRSSGDEVPYLSQLTPFYLLRRNIDGALIGKVIVRENYAPHVLHSVIDLTPNFIKTFLQGDIRFDNAQMQPPSRRSKCGGAAYIPKAQCNLNGYPSIISIELITKCVWYRNINFDPWSFLCDEQLSSDFIGVNAA